MTPEQRQFIDKLLPHRMYATSMFNLALRFTIKWDQPKVLEIKFDGKTCIEGFSTAFTNPVIESGIIHCRALLEFIGLKLISSTNNAKLACRHNKRNKRNKRIDDLVIEDFTSQDGEKLSKVTIKEALSPYKGASDEAEKALARVFLISNKRIAHSTSDMISRQDDFELLEIASRGVPTLLINYFYKRIGLDAPDYKIKSRNRECV